MKITGKIAPAVLLLAISLFSQEQESRLWQDDLEYLVKRIEIMHPNPYAQFPRAEFTKLKDELSARIPGMNEAEIAISISELLAHLRDGHTRMGFEFSDPGWLDRTFHLLPFILYPFPDGVHILGGMPAYKEWVGAKILRIGNMPVEEAARKLGALYSHDNRSGERKSLYYTLGFAEMLKYIGATEAVDKIDLTLQTAENKEKGVGVRTVSFISMARHLGGWYPQAANGLSTMNETAEAPLPLWLKNREKSFWFEYVPQDKMMYLQINSLNIPRGNEPGSFGSLCEDFFKAFDEHAPEKLVIDVRANNGGNHVELPLLKGILARPFIDRPDRLFLITGIVTYSAAVHFTTVFRKFTRATVIGEPTAGRPNHYGAIRRIKLPNHPQVVIGCSIDYYQDSEPFDFNTAHVPDILAEMTAADYRNNVDPCLERVRDYGRIAARVPILEEELKNAYTAGGLEAMKLAYGRKKGELKQTGYSPEKFFLEFRTNWFINNKKSASDELDYLAFSFAECPESIDLGYLLAVRLEAEGRLEDAKTHYRRCLRLNPECHYAAMKLGLLDQK
jgi:hypothetical protein